MDTDSNASPTSSRIESTHNYLTINKWKMKGYSQFTKNVRQPLLYPDKNSLCSPGSNKSIGFLHRDVYCMTLYLAYFAQENTLFEILYHHPQTT